MWSLKSNLNVLFWDHNKSFKHKLSNISDIKNDKREKETTSVGYSRNNKQL